MELNDIRLLIDQYLDGETSLSEEQAIAEYFATHEDIPADLLPIKAMFSATTAMRSITYEERPTTTTINLATAAQAQKQTRRRWLGLTIGISVAACMVLGVFTMLNRETATEVDTTPQLACYINGEQINDIDQAYMETDRILNNVAANVELAMARVDEIKILSLR